MYIEESFDTIFNMGYGGGLCVQFKVQTMVLLLDCNA